MRLRDQVTRVRAPLVDGPYGNQQRDWDNATAQPYPAEVQPVSSTEDVVNQQQTVTRWRMFLGADADLEATDRFEWDGGTYEVDGDVERWKRRGVLHHLEAVLMRVDLAEG
ncbi:phage head completion protein [Micromonospora cathayae]|uniref:Head-tail adaptor protein n=1 Tax=Micromonospora cathayae TaxID=3028804 RepID=A0ABY7ZYV0_9ACTN|nr:head-tail adaptor protein [Micromonospora sp. HUAS 3]WDZ87188.1 head-tail adaptor protein [Micromonospora sp. HUAS 3]